MKLARAVHEARAYDCPSGTKEKRWRAVVDAVKGEGNSSELFKLLVPNSAGSTSHRTLEKYFTRLFDDWEVERVHEVAYIFSRFKTKKRIYLLYSKRV